MSLQFLRPMALPRPTTLRYFLGVARLTTDAPIKATPTPILTPISTDSTTPTSSTKAPTQLYRVNRTPSNNLPVYLLAKAGGTLKQTRLRKIEGDIGILREQLLKELGLGERDVVINQLTRQIIIKGWKKPEVEKFLEERRF